MSTEDVGIGSPEASTGVLLADISADVGVGGSPGRSGGERAKGDGGPEMERGGWGPEEEQVRAFLTPLCVLCVGFGLRALGLSAWA
jgi:hypothetical protein